MEQTGKFLEPGSRIDLKDELNRAQAVSIISRSQIADTKIASLLNWDEGYFAKPVDSQPSTVSRQSENDGRGTRDEGRRMTADGELSSVILRSEATKDLSERLR
jgi:hypothetical protein